ncbi:MAG: hypothetical protein FJ264_08605 [Planctomycetes bacterium]|nr:hypothetical protein [Planctomycetota bacterium]
MIDKEKIRKTIIEIFDDPECFLLKKYSGEKPPKGFRVELFLARKFNTVRNNLKEYECIHYIVKRGWREEKRFNTISFKNLRRVFGGQRSAKKQEAVFCRYCEKRVVPVRIHKLDFGDVMLFFFTAGIWAILLFFMYLFIRRCPYCNHSLRKLRPLSKDNR